MRNLNQVEGTICQRCVNNSLKQRTLALGGSLVPVEKGASRKGFSAVRVSKPASTACGWSVCGVGPLPLPELT